MEEAPITHPGVPTETYHTLGKKTFWVFVLERIHTSAVILLVAICLFAVKDQAFLKNIPLLGDLTGYMNVITWTVFGIFAVAFLIVLLIAWLIYANYKFSLGDDALKIKRGVLNKEEVAMPYRQIQDVDIQRDLGFQMMGLSKLVILTAGAPEEKSGDDQSEGILPALDKDLAEWLQAELLKRANIQKVTETR
ncbi:MAG: PH domain-containing protein [Minisyncoccia bacterium]